MAFALPTLATASLLMEVLFISPKHYFHAKYKIVNANSNEQLLKEEKAVPRSLQDEIRENNCLPPNGTSFMNCWNQQR